MIEERLLRPDFWNLSALIRTRKKLKTIQDTFRFKIEKIHFLRTKCTEHNIALYCCSVHALYLGIYAYFYFVNHLIFTD